MVWLMRIYNSYENQNEQALQLSEYLFKTYPDNPYFHRYYARMLYTRGLYNDLELESKAILTRIDSGDLGYEATSGRYASFFLGQLGEARRKPDDAKILSANGTVCRREWGNQNRLLSLLPDSPG